MLSYQPIAFAQQRTLTLKPVSVLVLHKGNSYHSNVDAITHHELKEGKIQQGIALDKARLIEVIGAEKNTELTWLEPMTLLNNTKYAVWYRPSQRRVMHFKSQHGNEQFAVTFPATLFMFNRETRQLFLYALPNNKRPNPDTILYRLPIGNVSDSGALCLGSGASYIPNNVEQDNFAQVERAFFDAASTHTNTTHLFQCDLKNNRKTPFSELIRYWKVHAKDNKKPSVRTDFIRLSTLSDMAMRVLK